jgi:hypothetical protein
MLRVTPALRRVLGVVSLAWGTLVAGCAVHDYAYWPEGTSGTRIAGRPAALYGVPRGSPRGSLRVAALGVATLEPRDDAAARIRTMHVRMIASNDDDAGPWWLDTRSQIGGLDGFGRSRPAFAWSSAGRPPAVSVPPGSSASVDLYYPLPEDMQSADEIPQFDVAWEVQTPAGVVAERTAFARVAVEAPAPAAGAGSYAWGIGGGIGWGSDAAWYDPRWPEYAFLGAPGILFWYRGRPVVQVPPPPALRPPPPRPPPPRRPPPPPVRPASPPRW